MAGKILILGGGFGGVRTALDLEKKLAGDAEITLVDRNPYHLFVPALYEAASAYITAGDPFSSDLRKTVAVPFADIFHGKHVNFVQAEVQDVNLKLRTVTTKSGQVLSYDYLVLGMGSDVADFGIPGVREYAFQFKTVYDAMLINRHLEDYYNTCVLRGENDAPLSIFVAGAGFSGIELAAELSLLARKIAKRCGVGSSRLLIYLVEAQPRFLPNISQTERDIICKRLTKLGVVILENSPIESVLADRIHLKSGKELKGEMVIWTAGIVANQLLRSVDELELTPRGKIIVDENLRVLNQRNVFAVGDNIEFIDHATQKPVPALAYLAVDHGQVAARNIVNSIEGRELSPHKPFYGVWIAPIGGKWALAHLWRGISISGFPGWVLREAVDLKYFLSILPFFKAMKFFFNEILVFRRND